MSAETAGSGIAGRVATGAAFMVASRFAMRLISIVSTLVLVRLLVPEDFGIIALAAALFAVADTLSALGLSQLLIRRETADRDAYDTAFTMNLIRAALLAGLVAATAPLQAALMGEPRIEGVLYVVAATVLLDGLTSIGLVRRQRELRFDAVFRHQVAQKLAAFLLTMLLAFTLGNYWCLVLGNLGAKLFTVPYSYWLAPHRPRLCLAHWREFFNFSKWMFGINLCTVTDGQIGNLGLGAVEGVRAVGVYNVAYQIGALPVTELAAPVRQPLYAGYATVLSDAARLRDHYLQSFGLVFAVTVPLSVGIALVAPEAERILLGPNFAGAWPVIALCALYALFDSLVQFPFSLYPLQNRMRRMFALYGAMVAARVPIALAGLWLGGIEGLLWGLLLSSAVNAAVSNRDGARLLGTSLRRVLAELRRPALAAVAMAAAVLALRLWGPVPAQVPGILDDALRLAMLAAAGAAVHLGVQAALWALAGFPPGPERRALHGARGAWRRVRGGRRRAVPVG